MATLALVSASAAKKAIEKVISDIYELCTDEMKVSAQRWKTQAQIENLYKKLRNIRYVKTVWQFEREVDLFKIYYPTKVRLDNEITVISDLDAFRYTGNFLIQGTVGQGKSIFLRYLTVIELLKRRAIPLFIELRRIREPQTLMDHLLQEMAALGLSISESVFKKICQAGKVILFLDAFDEVGEALKQRLLSEIE